MLHYAFRGEKMEYKEDWEQAKKRISAFWHGEIIDRICISVRAPRANVKRKEIKPPDTLEERWTNMDFLLESAEENIRCTYWGGEAVPHYIPNIGPHFLAACLGCELKFAEGTSWVVEPLIKSWDGFQGLKFNPENKWWKWVCEMTERTAKIGKDKFLTAIHDLHGGGAALSALRGVENFCMDLIEHPEEVKKCLKFINDFWFHAYKKLFSLTQKYGQEGSYSWLGWAPGKTCYVQDDFIALISPEHFKEFFRDAIISQTEFLDYSIFHLDGPDCIKHLDLLLEIPSLNGIQWVPGAGHMPMTKWIPLLKRIQSAGKLLHINIDAQELETILSELSPKGLMIVTWVKSEEDAKELIKKAEKLTKMK